MATTEDTNPEAGPVQRDSWTCPGGSEHGLDVSCDGYCAVEFIVNEARSDVEEARAALAAAHVSLVNVAASLANADMSLDDAAWEVADVRKRS